MSVSAGAAGLGKLSVHSALGQPLRAEIELVSVQKEDLGALSAKLASAEAFRQARIERLESLNGLRFSVEQRANGQPVLKITSSAPVDDPFMDMLIELNWGSGRLLREYTVLLDPPAEFRPAPAPSAVQPAVVAPSAKKEVATVRPAAPDTAKPKAAATPAKAPADHYGPVRSGDTLRGIASRTRVADVTIDQMMVGLYQRNRQAFIHNNMNLLRKGAVLNVPDRAAALQVDPGRAAQMVRDQVAAWENLRTGQAASPAEEKAASGKVVPKAPAQAAPAPAPAKDVLKLSKGAPAVAGKPDAKMQEKMHSLEEEVVSKARALDEAQQKVAELERTVRDMQRLLELKSQEPAPAGEAAPAPQPAAQAPEPPKAVPPVAPAPVVAPEQAGWMSTLLSNPLYIGGLVAAVLLSVLLWVMLLGTRRRKGLNTFEDSIMTGGEFKNEAVFNTTGTAGGTGTTAQSSMLLTDFSRLGLGAIDTHEVDPIAEAEVYMAYGRDAQAEEILKEALAKDPARHEITLKLLEIYASRKDAVTFETLASELYASLGGQPTEVWQEAAKMGRGIDPDNPLYRISPSSALAGAGPAVAAAAVAPAIAEAMPAVEAAMEFEAPVAEPEPAEAEAPAAEVPAEDQLLDFEPSFVTTAAQPVAESEAAPAGMPEALEFPVEAVAEEQPEVSAPDLELPAETMTGLDFSMPETSLEAPSVEEVEIVEAPAVEAPEEVAEAGEMEISVPSLDDLLPEAGWDEAVPEAAEPVAEAAAPTMPDLDFSGIDLDLKEAGEGAELAAASVEEVVAEPAPAAPVAEAAGAAGGSEIDPVVWEETNTKLDLARAYLDMGDKEGAREILQEVLSDGDSKQQEEARKLLSEAE